MNPPAPLLACDPGFAKSNATGCACFFDGKLVAAGAISPKADKLVDRLEEVVRWMGEISFAPHATLVIELPKIYPGPQQKGDPDDVVLLATLAGMIAGRVPHGELRLPRPQEWKGNVPKDVMLKRIEGRLEPAEKAVLEAAKGKRDAILDACGIGMWALQRLGQR